MSKLDGKWNVTVKTYMGDQHAVHEYHTEGDTLTGIITDGGNGNTATVEKGKAEGDHFSFEFTIRIPIGEMTFEMAGDVSDDGNTLSGTSKNSMGEFEFTAVRA